MKKTVIMLIMIIVFVAVFSGCKAPVNDITGLWYEKTGLAGTLEFKDDGVVIMVMLDQTYNGTYKFDAAKGEGTITLSFLGEEETADLTLIDGQLNIDEQIYTRDKVEQQDLGDMLNELGGALGN